GTFGASDAAYSLAYGLGLSTRASLGASVKLVDQTLDGVRATSLAVDAGGLARSGRLSLGGGVRNLGAAPRFRETADPLPWLVYGGVAWAVRPGWLAAADLRLPRDRGPSVALGTERSRDFAGGLRASVRAGFNSANVDAGGLAGASLGVGVALRSLRFDFAWVPFGTLGDTFRYSLLVRF
ncbi:MAG: hypothetical protein HY554_11760, partial [Elusimicrobia bacterium]|nr:hypothetical protein [Elusimicrobiota bacterium]